MDSGKFFNAFLRNPAEVGSIVQSSPFLVNKIIKPINFKKARVIVEFGAGTGVVTKKILEMMPQDSTLVCFEKEEGLCNELKKKFHDKRLIAIADGAENFERYLGDLNISKVDYFVSELPIAILPVDVTEKVLALCDRYLCDGGKYIQIQYSLVSRKHLRKLFSQMSIDFTPFNIPPSFVYVCTK